MTDWHIRITDPAGHVSHISVSQQEIDKSVFSGPSLIALTLKRRLEQDAAK